MNKNAALVCLLVLCSFGVCFGQNSEPKSKPCPFRVKCSEPSIYLTYEKIVQDKSKNDSEDENVSFVQLRFHNNTRWQILLDAGGGITQDEVRLFYDFLDENGLEVESTYCHVCSLIRVSGGKSFPFKVPLRYFQNSVQMRIGFNYEWEDYPFSSKGQEPLHYVYFDTPPQLKNKQ